MKLRLHISAAVATILIALPALSARHDVPLFISAANNASGQQGFVRLVNHTDMAGAVTVRALDDAGSAFGPEVITLDAWSATHFNSNDLEKGNARKGLSGVGSGTGDWRLQIESDLRLEVLVYVRTSDGFLTAIHGEARQPGAWHLVPIFNPGSNTNQVSKLRLANPGEATASVAIVGVDDSGATFQTAFTVEAQSVQTISAQQLESGAGLPGRGLGNGTGKWRLHVGADTPISVMSLMETPTGHITNLAHSTSYLDPALPEQITPPRAASGFRLGSGWPKHRIAYAEGQLLVALIGGCPFNSGIFARNCSLVDPFGALGQGFWARLFQPGWARDDVSGFTNGGQGVLYFSNTSRRRVMAYSLEGWGDESRTIDVPWPPHELAFGQGKLFVVTWVDDDEWGVRQLTPDGQEVGAPFPLSSRNENPVGMAYWDSHLYVVDADKEQVFVYSVVSGERVQRMEFELDPENDDPQGIEYANGRFYVPDIGDDWVYAYTASGETVEYTAPAQPAKGAPASNGGGP